MFISVCDGVSRTKQTSAVTTSRTHCRPSSTLRMPTRQTAGCVRKSRLSVIQTAAKMRTQLRSVVWISFWSCCYQLYTVLWGCGMRLLC